MDRQCWANAQYSRRKCLDIVCIPHEVSVEVLEEKVLKMFGKLGCDISPYRIEACHRVSRTVIVKFSKRKNCQHVWSVKKDLKKLAMEDFELTRSKSKKLHSLDKSFFISGDTIKIRVNENSSLAVIDR